MASMWDDLGPNSSSDQTAAPEINSQGYILHDKYGREQLFMDQEGTSPAEINIKGEQLSIYRNPKTGGRLFTEVVSPQGRKRILLVEIENGKPIVQTYKGIGRTVFVELHKKSNTPFVNLKRDMLNSRNMRPGWKAVRKITDGSWQLDNSMVYNKPIGTFVRAKSKEQ